jgi:hypothetical protein
MKNSKSERNTPNPKGTILLRSFDDESFGENVRSADGFERACFLDGPTGKEGDTRGFATASSARRKSRTTRDDEPEVFSLPDEEPEGWALP